MAKPVNHKERKREICATSIRLFAQRGYQDVNFGTIAKECGISRTLVYTYFKDKRTIFNQAIIELTTAAADKYHALKCRQTPSSASFVLQFLRFFLTIAIFSVSLSIGFAPTA